VNARFARLATAVAKQCGSPWFFALSLVLTLAWLATGPAYGWSDAWNFVANSSTTVLTWLLAILVLYTQNRDTAALNLKLDELVRVDRSARNEVIGAEKLAEEEIQAMRKEGL
jgi:low affinity Fe/Cu permease